MRKCLFGKPCGLMDQTASPQAACIHRFEHPEAPGGEEASGRFQGFRVQLRIVDTKGSHGSLTADYAALRSEMESVAAFFGKKVLRQVDEAAFYRNIPALRAPSATVRSLRAIHFFQRGKAGRTAGRGAYTGGILRRSLRMVGESGGSSFQYLQNVYTVREPQRTGGIPWPGGERACFRRTWRGPGSWRRFCGGTIQAFVENGYGNVTAARSTACLAAGVPGARGQK